MFTSIRIRLARLIAPDYFETLENSVNRRVAQAIAQIDPFEPVLREFHGVFSTEYERPEDNLDARGQLGMEMWGWQQAKDPHFKHLTEWVMNTHANETLKRAPVTTERIQYGRALLAVMILFRKEVGRLASVYDDRLAKEKGEDFNSALSVE